MRMMTGTLGVFSVALTLAVTPPASSEERVGIVTTVIGPVTVTRASLPTEPLKFKDGVFLRDRVTTGDNAMTRILMGGKVLVTARERSTLTITEVPGLSTIDLTSGRIAVAVDKTRMKPGERVDVRTPNAIAGVRGTVLIVEAQGNSSTVTVLTGLVDVVRLDPSTGQAVGPITPVAARQAVTVRDNVLPPRPQAITPARSQQLSEQFTPPMRTVDATSVMPVQDEVARATTLANQLLPIDAAGAGVLRDGLAGDNVSSTSSLTTSTGVAVSTGALATSSTLGATTTSITSPTTTLLSAPTTLVPTTGLLPAATTLPTTTLVPTTTVVPTTSAVPTGSSLLQPIVQPVVQNVVQPTTQTVLDPLTKKLLK